MNGIIKNCVLTAVLVFLGMTVQLHAQDIYLWNDSMLYQDEDPWELAGWGNLTASYDVQFYYDTTINVYLMDQPFHYLDIESGSTSAEVLADVDPGATYYIISELFVSAFYVGPCYPDEYYDIFAFWWYGGETYGDWWYDFVMTEPSICVSEVSIYLGNLILEIDTPPRIVSSTACTAAGNSNNARTTIGLGEVVYISTDPAISVTWSVTGGGNVSPVSGTSTTFTSPKTPTTCTVHASIGNTSSTKSFSVLARSGISVTLGSDSPLGDAGPPNNYIGARSLFDCTVLPTTVSFFYLSFRENIPGDSWTWPDSSAGSRGAEIVPWGVGCDNKTTDTVNSTLFGIGRIFNGSSYVDFGYSIRVPEEYQNGSGSWVSWLPGETHPREYRGSDQKARVTINATNSANGSWQGPYK
jgi:hypothetical protein